MFKKQILQVPGDLTLSELGSDSLISSFHFPLELNAQR